MGKVMVMMGSKLTSKGQTTIPKEIREYLGLRPGDRVLFLRRGQKIVLQALKQTLLDLRGSVMARGKPEDFKAVRQKVKHRIARRAARG